MGNCHINVYNFILTLEHVTCSDLLKYSTIRILFLCYLRYVCKPMPPIWLTKIVFLHVLNDLSKIELWSVPTANPIIGAEIALDLEFVGCWRVPLKNQQMNKWILGNNKLYSVEKTAYESKIFCFAQSQPWFLGFN